MKCGRAGCGRASKLKPALPGRRDLATKIVGREIVELLYLFAEPCLHQSSISTLSSLQSRHVQARPQQAGRLCVPGHQGWLSQLRQAPRTPSRLTQPLTQNAPVMHQRRNLSIHEYRSAKLLESYGIGVPKGDVAHNAAEAEQVAKGIRMRTPSTNPKHTSPC